MWVKICGIRDVRTAEQVCLLGPDAIGLNFYAQSPRFVSRATASQIAGIAGKAVERVGVFVNHSPSEIVDTVGACLLDAIQLHGDESADQIAKIATALPDTPIFCAWRMAGETLDDLARHLEACEFQNVKVAGCLIDSRVSGSYGGTGKTVSWPILSREYRQPTWPPLVLAGGLTPDNVVVAIQTVQPWGVDVASGVESAPGIKNIQQVQRFILNARNA